MLKDLKQPKALALIKVLFDYDWSTEEVPAGAFKESGTNIETRIIRVVKS
jgi:hypothetical protein